MLRITTVVDNHAAPGFLCEHGYSLYIEARQCRVLFDTGQSQAFSHNLQKLGIDSGKIDFLVLSHGHYDHTGGLDFFLKHNHHARVYSLQGVEKPRFRRSENGVMKYIGMPPAGQKAFLDLPAWRRCQPETEDTGTGYIVPGIGLTGKIPRECEFEPPESYFFLDEQAQTPDIIADDNSIWIETPKGIILICGCCHAGLVNTITTIASFMGKNFRLRGIIGGLHLAQAGRKKLDSTVALINRLKPEFVIPAHCTGATLVPAKFSPPTSLVPSAAGQIFEFSE